MLEGSQERKCTSWLMARSQDVVRVTPLCRTVAVIIFKYVAFLVQPTSAFGCLKAFSNSSC